MLLAPCFGGVPTAAFLCGDDPAAKEIVTALARDIGLDPVDAGGMANAPLVESLTKLWAQLSRTYGREFAFAALRR